MSSVIPGGYFTGRRSYLSEPDPLSIKSNQWDNFGSSGPLITETSPAVNSKINWEETQTDHVFRIDLPGFKKEEVTVSVDDGLILKITGVKCVEKADSWNRVERVCGRFVRSVWLPNNSKPYKAEACMENGVLTVRVPKQEMVNPHGNSIRVPLR